MRGEGEPAERGALRGALPNGGRGAGQLGDRPAPKPRSSLAGRAARGRGAAAGILQSKGARTDRAVSGACRAPRNGAPGRGVRSRERGIRENPRNPRNPHNRHNAPEESAPRARGPRRALAHLPRDAGCGTRRSRRRPRPPRPWPRRWRRPRRRERASPFNGVDCRSSMRSGRASGERARSPDGCWRPAPELMRKAARERQPVPPPGRVPREPSHGGGRRVRARCEEQQRFCRREPWTSPPSTPKRRLWTR